MASDTRQLLHESLSQLQGFVLERVLDQDPRTRTASLLGTFPASHDDREQAVVLLEKTHFADGFYSSLGIAGAGARADQEAFPHLSKVEVLGQNNIYTWLLGWHASPAEGQAAPADLKISIIRPCTKAHILKYESQEKYMVYETPELYKQVVEPWIASQDVSRIQWVYNILDKKKESENILYEDTDPETGFIILPDLKWDRRTLSSLYLVAIVNDRSLRSLRDLRPGARHISLLNKICAAAAETARTRFGLEDERGGALRCFIHYQPTYYHLHVHILAASFTSHPGAIVGQAHLVQDVVDLLRLGVDFRERTLGYALGERSELWDVVGEQVRVQTQP